MANLTCNLPLPLLKRLEEERNFDKYIPKSLTAIVQEALALYFMAKDRERLAPVPDPLRYYPVTPAECTPDPPTPYMQDGVLVTREIQEGLQDLIDKGVTPDAIPEQGGLVMSGMTKTRVRPDPNKHISIFAHEIRPGDGVVGRLRAAGIDPLEITKAKRNKRAGREYDKTLEQYFDLL